MSRIAVAGVVTLCMARGFEAFPIPFVPSNTRPGEISLRLSGTGWTAARTLQRLGTDVTFATYVGADAIGQLAVQGMRRHGLYGPATLVCDEQPRAMVLYDAEGRRAGASDLRSTPHLRYPAELFLSIVEDHDAAILTNIGFTRSLVPVAVDRGIPIATDVHLIDTVESAHNRDWMAAAHVLACSHERLPGTPEDWVRDVWRKFGTETVLVGCAAGGAVLGIRASRRIWHVEAVTPRGVRFVAGAGDTLLATFVHHYFTRGDPVAAARQAVLAAGWKVGGDPDEEPGVPTAHRDLPGVRLLG